MSLQRQQILVFVTGNFGLDDAKAEHPADVEAAWAAEIERRARRVMAGESAGIPWEDVRQRAEAELRRR